MSLNTMSIQRMHITLQNNVNGVIATDDIGGVFFLGTNNAVYYRNPDDALEWFVNSDEQLFRKCTSAFSRYCKDCGNAVDEDALVQRLEQELAIAKALGYEHPHYWSIILEQCKDGLL